MARWRTAELACSRPGLRSPRVPMISTLLSGSGRGAGNWVGRGNCKVVQKLAPQLKSKEMRDIIPPPCLYIEDAACISYVKVKVTLYTYEI